MGDFTDLPIESISAVCDFKQVVKVITRGEATLDLILTNKSNSLFEEPVSLPKIGDGDHFPILYLPKNYIPPKSIKKIVKMRKFPKSTKNQFGAWISCFDWGQLYDISDPNDKVSYFTVLLGKVIDIYFPLSNFVISSTGKEWVRERSHIT